MFGSCKSISRKFPFFGNAIFRKLKCFHVFGCISKKFPKNIFWCLENATRKRQTQKTRTKPRLTLDARLGSTARCFASSNPTTAPSIVISQSTAPLREIAIDASRDHDRREGEILTGCNSTNLSRIFDPKLIILTRYTSSLAIRVLSISPTFSFSF